MKPCFNVAHEGDGWRLEMSAKAASVTDGEILIYGNIAENKWWEGQNVVIPKDFDAAVKALGAGLKNLLIRVHCYGGSVFAGQAIVSMIDALRKSGVKVTAKIDGLGASMGSVIPQAADRLVMAENAMMMVHKPSGLAWGNADAMLDTAEMLDKAESQLITLYMRRFNGSKDELVAMLRGKVDGTWLTADEALEHGLCDEVEEPVEMAACAGGFMFNGIQVSASALKGAEDKIHIYNKKGGEKEHMVYNKEIDAKIKAMLDEGKAVAVMPDEKAEGGFVVSEVAEGQGEEATAFLTAEAARDALGEDVSGENILALLAVAKDTGASFEAVVGAVKNIGQEPQANPDMVKNAAIGKQARENLEAEAHKNAVRVLGDKYDKATHDAMFAALDYEGLLTYNETLEAQGDAALHVGQGRVSVTPGDATDGGELNPADIF